MRRWTSVIVGAVAVAIGLAAGSAGTASAAPNPSIPGLRASDDPGVHYVNFVNTGRVTRVATHGFTVALTDTALDRSWCNTGVFAGTAADFIALEPSGLNIEFVDIPGADIFISVAPSVVDIVGFPVAPELTSPVTVSATLPAGKYTAFSYCYTFDAADNEIPNANYYLDEFTLPSLPRFGSS